MIRYKLTNQRSYPSGIENEQHVQRAMGTKHSISNE